MKYFYYISILDKAPYTENYPHDYVIEKIKSYTLANFLIEDDFSDLFKYNNEYDPFIQTPRIVTNDPRLYLKYRCVLSEEEFKKNVFNNEIIQHVGNIISGKYNKAFMVRKYENWIDENGYSREWVQDAGWKTDNDCIINNELHESYKKHISSLNDEFYDETDYELYENLFVIEEKHYEWWENLSLGWKNLFKQNVDSGIFKNIPTEQALYKILNIDYLNIPGDYRSKIDNLEPLRHLKSLEVLIAHNNNIEDINVLNELPNLRKLDLSNNKIKSLEPLENNTNLEFLDCSNNYLIHLGGIESLNKLTIFKCSNNKITSLLNIRKHKSLKELYCNDNQIHCLFPISAIKDLEILDCSNNKIVSIEPLEDLTNLKTLNIRNNEISSIETLKNHKKIKELKLIKNKFSYEMIKHLDNLYFSIDVYEKMNLMTQKI